MAAPIPTVSRLDQRMLEADMALAEPDEALTAIEGQRALCRALTSRGVALETYRLTDLPGSPAVGQTARLRSCELAFRLEEPGLLLLIHYRRLERSASLRNPFADLIGFLLLATRPEFAVCRVMGQIRTEPHPDGDGLSDGRLARFYERFFHTRRTRFDCGEWLYSDIEPLRRRLVEVGHQAVSLDSPSAADESTTNQYQSSPGSQKRQSIPAKESRMSTREEAQALAKRATELIAQHEKLYADHGLSIDVSDEVLKRDDLGDEARSKLEQELTNAREGARAEQFASAREERQGHKHKPHSGMI